MDDFPCCTPSPAPERPEWSTVQLAELWHSAARWGWEQSGEGWNDEIACQRPDLEPDFDAHNPYLSDRKPHDSQEER